MTTEKTFANIPPNSLSPYTKSTPSIILPGDFALRGVGRHLLLKGVDGGFLLGAEVAV